MATISTLRNKIFRHPDITSDADRATHVRRVAENFNE